jgi:hypothetical protein
MKGIKYDFNGTQLTFGPAGDVAQVVNGELKTVGAWRSESAERDNQVRFTLNGQEQAGIRCQYRFNASNQLVVRFFQPNNTLTDEFTFIGRIEVSEPTSLTYALISGEGLDMQRNVIVYGKLHFDSDNALMIDLAGSGGGSARIRGDGGLNAIEAAQNLQGGIQAGDLLKFHATTVNVLDVNNKKKSCIANISIPGNWDIDADNTLVFKATSVPGGAAFGFAGKFKGVAGGFAYMPGAAGASIAFVVKGQHQWNSGSSSWDINLGFSKNKLIGELRGSVVQQLPHGAIALSGTMDIGKHAFDFEVQLRHSFNQANFLIFTADVSTTPGSAVNYDLKLEGHFSFNGTTLTFTASVSKQDGLEIEIASTINKGALQMALAATLDIKPGDVKLSFTFSLTMHFVDGKLTKDKALPAHA